MIHVAVTSSFEYLPARGGGPRALRGSPDQNINKRDLPVKYRTNVDIMDPPFFNRWPGQKPALSEGEIQDLIAFLKTLDDGYSGTAGGVGIGRAR